MSVLIGSQTINAATLATPQSLTIPSGTVLAKISCEIGSVRFTTTGTPPTSSSGTLVTAAPSGGPVVPANLMYLDQFSAAAAQFILATAGAILTAHYFSYVD
jgi:hypothetical protein